MMMKSVFWWRKPEYPEETTDLRQVTDEHTQYGYLPKYVYTRSHVYMNNHTQYGYLYKHDFLCIRIFILKYFILSFFSNSQVLSELNGVSHSAR